MKFIKQTLLVSLALIAASSFAASTGTGVDTSGTGKVTFTGTSVGSCGAPTVTVALGNIDFHTQANGPTGVYTHAVDLSVTCTNPNQTWVIIPHVSSFSFSSGANGSNVESGYVSIADAASAPGTDWSNSSAFLSAFANGTPADVVTALKQGGMMAGTGTSTIATQLTFGKSLPAGVVADHLTASMNEMITGGVPTGTIDGRGDFAVDIPLQIMY